MKDDSGSYAVFTEQGSSASQMRAAKVMDIISRLPGCAGQAADAVSACTQVKMEDAPKLLKLPKSECPEIWMRLPRHKSPKSSQWFLSNDTCTDTHLLASCGKDILKKFFWHQAREVRARLPGCAGQAADAIFAHTQRTLQNCSKFRSQSVIVLYMWKGLHGTNGKNHTSNGSGLRGESPSEKRKPNCVPKSSQGTVYEPVM